MTACARKAQLEAKMNKTIKTANQTAPRNYFAFALMALLAFMPGLAMADDWIAERAVAGDIVVTADIPLASRCLKAGAKVIGSTGKPFTDANIGSALAMRDLQQHLRETGESKGYNASFTKQDRSRFLQALEQAVQDVKRGR